MLLLARSVVGIGEATLMPAAFSMLADSFPYERRGRAFGYFTAAAAIGTGGALVLGGAVMRSLKDVHSVDLGALGTFAPWQVAFMVVGAPGLIVAMLLLTVREPRRRTALGTTDGIAQTASLFRYMREHPKLFLCVLGAYSTYTSVCYATVSWAPTLLVRKFHFAISDGGFAVGACALTTGLVGTILGGFYADRWTVRNASGGKFRAPFLWSLVVFPVVLGFALSPVAIASVGCFAIFIALQNAVYATGGATMQDIVPPSLSGRATAVWYVVTGLFGQVTGPTFAALLNDYLFHDRAALPYSIVLVAIPGVLATLAFSLAGRSLVDKTRQALRANTVLTLQLEK
jgi:MFS family permease